MLKEFHEIKWPAQDGRDTIPRDEQIAHGAYLILGANDDFIYYATRYVGAPPEPPKSARVNARRKISPSEEIVEIRGTEDWFDAVGGWMDKANAYDLPESVEWEEIENA